MRKATLRLFKIGEGWGGGEGKKELVKLGCAFPLEKHTAFNFAQL